jgi:hypothetical protein
VSEAGWLVVSIVFYALSALTWWNVGHMRGYKKCMDFDRKLCDMCAERLHSRVKLHSLN